VLSKLGDEQSVLGDEQLQKSASLTLADKWILSRYNRLVVEVNRLMESYNFGEAGRQTQEFLWSEFADWYVEVAKVQLEGDVSRQQTTRAVLYTALEGSLRLLHPFIPFVTEEAWQYLTNQDERRKTKDESNPVSLMIAPYPEANRSLVHESAEADFGLLQEIIRDIRNVRNEYGVEPSRAVAAIVVAGGRAALLQEQAPLISRLARVALDQLTVVETIDAKPEQAAALVIGDVEVYLPLAGMIDLTAERARLQKELQNAEADLARREAKLGNESFVSRAPANVVQRERDGFAAAQAAAERLRERIGALG
jgi:valyl-tRNA synthetase